MNEVADAVKKDAASHSRTTGADKTAKTTRTTRTTKQGTAGSSKSNAANTSRKPLAKNVVSKDSKEGKEEKTKPVSAGRKPAPRKTSEKKVAAEADSSAAITVEKGAKPVGNNGPKRNYRNNTGHKKQGKNGKLSIIPLGGLGEVGKNMTAFKYDNQIIVIDGGVAFPEDELLGIDLVIPDYTYLTENRDMVKGFFITHAHEDHIGALPYILKDINVPVYGSRLTLGILQGKLKEHRVGDVKLREVNPRQTVTVGCFKIEFIRVTHSIPDSFAIAIHTPIGVILHISDFKIDMSPVDGQFMDLGRIATFGEQGVLLLLADSTNVEKEGYTASETTVGDRLNKLFQNVEGRIILTTFASNIHRIQQAVWAAERTDRKVAIVGRGMQNISTVASELGYLKVPEGMMIDISEVNNYPDRNVLILTTGSQGEPLSGLSRMATGEHRQVQIMAGDTVIISATPIPGNEKGVARTIDNLTRLGANVIYGRDQKIHVSGHASQEELKIILNMVKPKFFLPVHGEYRMLEQHAKLAHDSLDMPLENCFVMENGQVLEIDQKHGRINGRVQAGRILIDGLGVGDVGSAVLKDRKQLSQDGIVILIIKINGQNGKMVGTPDMISRGFIFVKEHEKLMEEARAKIGAIMTKFEGEGTFDFVGCKNNLRNNLGKFFFDRIQRRPIVEPIIIRL